MRLHSLTLDNVRGIEHLHIGELPDTGVLVIHGENEAGKSTIADAIDAVLNIAHKANNKLSRRLRPVHRDASPRVSLELTLGPVTFSITKQWYAGKMAELHITDPTRQNYTGGEAENKLEEILGEHLDASLANALFMRQDDLGEAIAAVGIPALTSALDDHQGGEAVAGTEDTALMEAVDKEYARYFTPKGSVAKELKAAQTVQEAAAAELSEARAALTQLQEHVDSVAHFEVQRDAAAAKLPEAKKDVEKQAELAEKAHQAAAEADKAHEALRHATNEVTHATQRVDTRTELSEEVTALQAEVTALHKALEEVQRKADQEVTQITSLSTQLTEAKSTQTKAQEEQKKALADQRLLADVRRLNEITEILHRLDELDKEIAILRERTAGRTITDDDVTAVEEARRAADIARGIADSGAPKLLLSSDPDTSIRVGGQDLELDTTPQTLELREGTSLEIGDVTAVYQAGDGGERTTAENAEKAEKKLAELLADLELEDLDAARAARDSAQKDSDQLDDLLAERKRLTGGTDPGELRAEAAELEERKGTEELDQEIVSAAVETASNALEEANRAVAEVEATLEPWREKEASARLIAHSTRIESAEDKVAAARAKLAAAKQESSTEELEKAVGEAEATRAARAEDAEAADAKLAEARPEEADELLAGARAQVESLEERHTKAATNLAKLSGYIEQATGAAEQVEQAEAEAELAEQRLASTQQRAAAVERLRSTLVTHRDAARARYAEPFANELTKLATTVFGRDVSFELSEDLKVKSRSIGQATVPLEELSGGAKEQLAILTRFAIAALVTEEQVPVPVIVDDALGATDPQRLERMAALFARVGKKGQVIVLTCHPSRYDRVAGKTEYSMTELKAG